MENSIRSRSALPPIAFAVHPTTGVTVMIRRGEGGYVALVTRLTADELNRAFGVTAAQARAMLARSMFGWSCRSADPATYAENPACVPMDARRVH